MFLKGNPPPPAIYYDQQDFKRLNTNNINQYCKTIFELTENEFPTNIDT